MINTKNQYELLLNIAKKLKKEITVYAVGGTAMMFHGLKDTTKDIDLVFENEKDRKEFENAAISLGYKKMNSIKVYGMDRENRPIMLTRQKENTERFDLFKYEVISFFFSKNMRKRSLNTFEFGNKLIVKIADLHDLIIMKCATDRQRDAEDVKNIIENQKIDWTIIIDEIKNQQQLGKKRAIWELGDFLEKIKNQIGVDVPNEIIDKLWNMLKKEVDKKATDYYNPTII